MYAFHPFFLQLMLLYIQIWYNFVDLLCFMHSSINGLDLNILVKEVPSGAAYVNPLLKWNKYVALSGDILSTQRLHTNKEATASAVERDCCG